MYTSSDDEVAINFLIVLMVDYSTYRLIYYIR
jgi:hypothetical protein